MPVLGYTVYNSQNYLARIFVKYMMVPEQMYFGFAFPAICGFVLTLTWPTSNSRYADIGPVFDSMVTRIRKHANQNADTAVKIVIVGIFVMVVGRFLPTSIRFFADLFFFSSFAAVLYIFFSNNRRLKLIVLPLFLLVLLISSLESSMFTIIVYMGVTIFSFFFIGTKISMLKKVSVFLAGVFLIIVLQNVKGVYRASKGNARYEGSKLELFSEIVKEQVGKGGVLLETNSFFPVFIRMNQGWNITLVMQRMPSQQDFDYGKELSKVALAAVVPRIFWPSKPEAGGKFNMKHYAGVRLVGWSTNVGPLGEAYGSFGVMGGVIYMLMLGLLIRFFYVRILSLSVRYPLLLLWLPVLFYKVTYSAETDTLQILNSLLKTSFFMWLIFKFLPSWYGIGNMKKAIQKNFLRNSSFLSRESLNNNPNISN